MIYFSTKKLWDKADESAVWCDYEGNYVYGSPYPLSLWKLHVWFIIEVSRNSCLGKKLLEQTKKIEKNFIYF